MDPLNPPPGNNLPTPSANTGTQGLINALMTLLAGHAVSPTAYHTVSTEADTTRFRPMPNPFEFNRHGIPNPLSADPIANMAFQRLLAKDRWTTDCTAADATAWIDKILSMCTDHNLVGPQFMSYMMHAFEKGPPLTWLHSIQGTLGPERDWTPAYFKERFLTHFAGLVRDPHVEALSQLINGQVQQGTTTVEAYAEHFLSIARKVPDISGAALCQLYIAGLNADLKPQCILTLTNTEWTNIHDLISPSSHAALRIRIATLAAKPPTFHQPPNNQLATLAQTKPHPGKKPARQWEHKGKKQKLTYRGVTQLVPSTCLISREDGKTLVTAQSVPSTCLIRREDGKTLALD